MQSLICTIMFWGTRFQIFCVNEIELILIWVFCIQSWEDGGAVGWSAGGRQAGGVYPSRVSEHEQEAEWLTPNPGSRHKCKREKTGQSKYYFLTHSMHREGIVIRKKLILSFWCKYSFWPWASFWCKYSFWPWGPKCG